MASIKRYQLLNNISLTTHFLVENSLVTVTFQHGMRTPEIVRGRFSTSDPGLQEAIEASPAFNVKYYLEKEEVTGKETPRAKIAEVAKATDYPDILTVKAARELLIELFPDELRPSVLPNRNTVMSRA